MADIEVKIPAMGESISEGTISRWFKKEGEAVKADEALFEIETDKVTQEIYAPASGVVKKIAKAQGANAAVGEVVAIIDSSATAVATPAAAPAPAQRVGSGGSHPVAESLAPRPQCRLLAMVRDRQARCGAFSRGCAERPRSARIWWAPADQRAGGRGVSLGGLGFASVMVQSSDEVELV